MRSSQIIISNFIIKILICIFLFNCDNYILLTKKNNNNLHFIVNSTQSYNKSLVEKEEREAILKKGIKYINKCIRDLNSSYNYYKKNEYPIITVIIPSFNCEKTIATAIRSVQYQNNSNFQIIVIDDYSKDNSKEIISLLKNKDKRINLIENKKNMGTLYSRSIGALFSKGNYILCLDNDDLFFDEDVFDIVYNKAIIENLDIVEFRTLFSIKNINNISKIKDYQFYNFENNLFISQPSLGIWTITLNGKFYVHNNLIWGKCIKSSIYKKAIKLLGIQRYSKYVCWAEDTSISFIIFNIAQSYKFIYKFGYIQIKRSTSASYSQNINYKLYGELFFLDVMLDFSKNTSDKNYAVNMVFQIKKNYKIEQYANNKNYNYLKAIINKIMRCQFISLENKQKIKIYLKTFIL